MKTERWYYSTLETAIADGPGRAPAAHWRAWLDGCQRRGEVSVEERAWVGIDAWLDQQQGRIPREAVLAYAQEHALQLREVVLGGPGQSRLADAETALIEHLVSEECFTRNGAQDYAIDAVRGELAEGQVRMASVATRKLTAELCEAYEEFNRAKGPPTQYANYRVPGGENYRELLLTLARTAADARSRGWQDYRDDLHSRGLEESDADEVRRWGIGAPAETVDQDAVARARSVMGDEWMLAYRDVLQDKVRRPVKDVERVYRSSHWDQPNVLAHVRFDERTAADGKRVLFLHEVQSDWHQAGRRNGYRSGPAEWATFEAKGYTVAQDGPYWMIYDYNGDPVEESTVSREAVIERFLRIDQEGEGLVGGRSEAGVPDAPFKATEDWVGLVMKRMTRWAADNGFERIAWVTGEQAAEMFALSKQVEAIYYEKNADGETYTVSVHAEGGRVAWEEFKATPDAIESHVGKEIAEKIVGGEGGVGRGELDPDGTGMRALNGLDLKVGGDGLRGFYDTIVPGAVSKWAKRFGAQVGDTKIVTVKGGRGVTGVSGITPMREFNAPDRTAMVHAIDLTPELKAAARRGFPLFGLREGRRPGQALRAAPAVRELAEDESEDSLEMEMEIGGPAP